MAHALRIEAVGDRPAPPAPPIRRGRQPRARQLRLMAPWTAGQPEATTPHRAALHALPGRPGTVPTLEPTDLVRAVMGASAELEALPVVGAGMPDALLNPGDTVMIQRGATLTQGELHAVVVPGQSRPVLRRLFLAGESLRLQPENRAFAAEEHPQASVRIVGRVVAMVRQASSAQPSAAAPNTRSLSCACAKA